MSALGKRTREGDPDGDDTMASGDAPTVSTGEENGQNAVEDDDDDDIGPMPLPEGEAGGASTRKKRKGQWQYFIDEENAKMTCP
jgi:hypothetical protein